MNIDVLFSEFRDFSDIKDIIDEKEELTYYYKNKQYAQMKEYISEITKKYPVEIFFWNKQHDSTQFATEKESYNNTIQFLNSKGESLLVEKGIGKAKFY